MVVAIRDNVYIEITINPQFVPNLSKKSLKLQLYLENETQTWGFWRIFAVETTNYIYRIVQDLFLNYAFMPSPRYETLRLTGGRLFWTKIYAI